MRRAALLSWLLALASCAAFDPSTGRERAAEAGAPTGDGYGKPPTDGGRDPRCAPDGGLTDTDCDGCETAHCCATRFGCYDDPACAAADEAFDACRESATADPSACWQSFGGSGPKAEARVACQQRECKAVCGVP
jgi:hypothetical protein